MVASTSSASKVRPWWNFTPSRSLKVQVLRSSDAVQLFARSGLTVMSRVDARQAVEDEMDVDVFIADRGLRRVELVERGAERDAHACPARAQGVGKRQDGRPPAATMKLSHAASPCLNSGGSQSA